LERSVDGELETRDRTPRFARALTAALSLLPAPTTLAAPPEGTPGPRLIPEVLYFEDYQPNPIFYAGSLLVEDQRGQVELAGASEAAALSARLLFEKSPLSGECRHVDSRLDPRTKPPRAHTDLSAVVSSNDVALIGRVVERRAGFAWNTPGTVLAVIPGKVLAGDWKLEEPLLVFVPAGRVESATRCVEVENEDWAEVPELGHNVLLLLEDNWFNGNSPLTHVAATGLIGLDDGEPGIPRLLRARLGGLSSHEIAAAIVAEIGKQTFREHTP
jgi:hypothetical protein